MVGIEGSVWGGPVKTEVQNPVNEGDDRAPVRVARTGQADQFTADSILLVRKFEGNRGGGADFRLRSGGKVDTPGATH